MLSKEQQACLCDGYVRNNCIRSTPLSINRLIQTFWSEYVWWTLKGNQMKRFLNANTYDTILGKQFKISDLTGKQSKIRGIPMVPILFPNGYDDYIGFVQYGLCLETTPNIKSMVVNYELYCIQTKAYCKKTKYYFVDIDGRNKLWLMMGNHQMKLSQFKESKQFDVMYYVDILNIEYKQDSDKKNYSKEIKMNDKSEYEWNIDQSMIELFKNGHRDRKEFSPSFNNKCWTLYLYPNGYDDHNYVGVGFRLLSIPHSIKQFELKVIIDIKPNIFHYEENGLILSNKNIFAGLARRTELTLNDIISKSNNSAISIIFQIQIIAVWIEGDNSLMKIDQDEMDKYGIIKS